MPSLVGVDGCPAGWIAVSRDASGEPAVATFTSFAGLVLGFPEDAVIAVDMPIGLPDRSVHGGRGPEQLVRALLGARQSSVFSIPSRDAVHAETAPFSTVDAWHAAHRRAGEVARRTSDPPRAVSIQAFGIFAKIREVDALLIARPDLRTRIFESHPELAFTRLNGDKPMQLPKKVKGAVNPGGMEERKQLLSRCGYQRMFLDRPPPPGAKADDFLDACVMMLIANRISAGEATPFPDPPLADRFGIPVAIWA